MKKPILIYPPARLDRDRKANPLGHYDPHPGQIPFHECDARERWIFGGNRSGKTEAGAVEVVKFIKKKMAGEVFQPMWISHGPEVVVHLLMMSILERHQIRLLLIQASY